MPRNEGTVEDSELVGKVVVEAGARIDPEHGARAGHHRQGRGDRERLRGPVHLDRRRRGACARARWSTPSSSRARASSDVGGRIESSLIGRNVVHLPHRGQAPLVQLHAGRPQRVLIVASDLMDLERRGQARVRAAGLRAAPRPSTASRSWSSGASPTTAGPSSSWRGSPRASTRRFRGFEVRQVNYSEMDPGVIKAFHLHRRQTDVWFVPPGDKMLLVLLDVRAGSPHRNAAAPHRARRRRVAAGAHPARRRPRRAEPRRHARPHHLLRGHAVLAGSRPVATRAGCPGTSPAPTSGSPSAAERRHGPGPREDPRHRRRRLHRLQLRAPRAGRASRRPRGQSRQAHLRGQSREPARRRDESALSLRQGRHLRRARWCATSMARRGRGRALRGRDPRGPLEPGRRRLPAHQRRRHLHPARGRARAEARPLRRGRAPTRSTGASPRGAPARATR